MLPFENMTADYVKETENHVLYRVTPVFEGNNLVAAGVLMEAESVEDKGEGVEFCVFVYNAQPGVTIDYATGDSWLDENGTGNQQAAAKETKTVVETEIQAERKQREKQQEERRRQHPEQVLVLLADSVSFPEKLQQTARLRLRYPELSLAQLADKCDPPVSKSCMNHRMRKLTEEAKKR